MSIERDAYAVLQVHPKAHPEVVSAAYRALARLFHPDVVTPDAKRMAELNGAYDRVKTPDVRRRYDADRSPLVAVGPGPRAVMYDAWPDSPPAGDGVPVLDFGRYSGWKIRDIAHVDPDYLRWLSRHSTGVRFQEAIASALPGDLDLGRRGHVVS